MSLIFFTFGHRVELLSRSSGSGTGMRVPFRDAGQAKRTLAGLLEQDQGLHRLRGFLAWKLRWQGLEKRRAGEVIDRAAQALYHGELFLLAAPIRLQATASSPRPVETPQDSEEWVEIAPEPAPVEEEEGYALSHESAQAVADSNRELAATGAPFKEICTKKDCPVCNGQLALTAG